MRSIVLSALLCTALMVPVSATTAQAQDRILTLPDGQVVLNIAASERTKVRQDTLIASLRVENEGADPRAVQNNINTLMKQAMDRAKGVTGVTISTGGYYVYQYDRDQNPTKTDATKPREVIWRGTQNIDLQSTNSEALLKLVGELQGLGLLMGNLSYTLSPSRADEAKDALMEQALAKVNARAKRAATALGKPKMDLIEISVDSADHVSAPYPMMRAMAMDGVMEKASAPVAEPGESEITLTVTARALLKP